LHLTQIFLTDDLTFTFSFSYRRLTMRPRPAS